MPALPTVTTGGQLTIGGVALIGPAWTVVEEALTDLWLGGDLRGEDRIIPGAAGAIPYPRRWTVTRRSIPMWINPDVDRTGAAHSSPQVGLWLNIKYLRENVVDPPGTTTGTRAAVLTLPDATTRTADVHVLGLTLGVRGLGGFAAALDISIPAGVFA